MFFSHPNFTATLPSVYLFCAARLFNPIRNSLVPAQAAMAMRLAPMRISSIAGPAAMRRRRAVTER